MSRKITKSVTFLSVCVCVTLLFVHSCCWRSRVTACSYGAKEHAHGAAKRSRLTIYYKRFVTRRNKIPPRQRVCRKQRLLTSFLILFENRNFNCDSIFWLDCCSCCWLVERLAHSTTPLSCLLDILPFEGGTFSVLSYPSWFVEQRA